MNMKPAIVAAIAFFSVIATVPAEEPAQPWKAGINFWFADIDYDFGGDDDSGDSVMIGPSVAYTWANQNWLSLGFSLAEEDYDGGSTDVVTADALFGHSIKFFEFGAGLRYWMNDYSSGGDDLEFGPIVYAGVSSPIAQSPVGVYGSASWNPVDFGDDEDAEHYTLDGGLSLDVKQAQARIGYRYKDYYETDGHFQYSGPTATIAVSF